MKKIFIILGIVAGAFAVIGGTLLGIGFAMGARNDIQLFNGVLSFSLGRGELVKQEYREIEKFDSLYIDMNLGRVEIVAGDEYGIEYQLYSDNVKCDVDNGKLTFKEQGRKNHIIGFDFGWFGNHKDSYIKIYVPEKKLDSVEVYADMGKVDIRGISCERLTLDCDMGAVDCKDLNVGRLNIDADMGGVEFDGTVTDKIDADVDMGSVYIEGWLDCDLEIDADMGSVDIVTYYSAVSYRYDFEIGMGGKKIHDNGGTDSEKLHYMNINCDMGDLNVTHEQGRNKD